MIRSLLAGTIVLFALAGCLHPVVNIIDAKTSLEQQAAGDYPQLGRELQEAGIQPGPVPLTREQVAQSAPAGGAPDESNEGSDEQRVDALLVRLCLGESLEGKLVETKESCSGEPDEQEVAHLMERSNKSRQQTWSYLGTLHPDAKPEAVRAAWRATRLRELLCGGQMQAADGSWVPKKC